MLRAMLALWGLAFCLSAHAQFIIVTDTGSASASTCTVAQAINAANAANSVAAASYGSMTPAGNCSGAVAGQNLIVFNDWPTITLSTIDNYWYGPNALPPIASQIFIGAVSGYSGATLAASHTSDPTPATANAFRFFYVSGGLTGELPAGKLTLSGLALKGGYAKGGNSGGGGGGAGMGGAIFNQGSLALRSVSLIGNTAQGGNSFSGYPYAPVGGGMGQDSAYGGPRAGGFGGPLSGSYGGSGGSGSIIGYGGGGGGGFLSSSGGGNAPNQGGIGSQFGGAGGGNGGLGGAAVTYGLYVGGAAGDGGGGGILGGFGGSGGGFGEGGQGAGGGGIGGGGGNNLDGCIGYDVAGGGGFGGGGGGSGAGGGSGSCGGGGGGGFGGGGGLDGGLGGFGAGDGGFALNGGGGGGSGMGGAIFNHAGTVSLLNVTATGNAANGGSGYASSNGSGLGAVLFNLNGNVTIDFSTLAGNSLTSSNAGVTSPEDGSVYSLAYGNDIASGGASVAALTIHNSIVYGTQADGDSFNDDVVGNIVHGANVNTSTLTYTGANIVQHSYRTYGVSQSGSVPITVDPRLGSLSMYGALSVPLPVLPIGPDSPAYNAVTICLQADGATTLTTDERGAARPYPIAGKCDIGAYEFDGDYIFANGFQTAL